MHSGSEYTSDAMPWCQFSRQPMCLVCAAVGDGAWVQVGKSPAADWDSTAEQSSWAVGAAQLSAAGRLQLGRRTCYWCSVVCLSVTHITTAEQFSWAVGTAELSTPRCLQLGRQMCPRIIDTDHMVCRTGSMKQLSIACPSVCPVIWRQLRCVAGLLLSAVWADYNYFTSATVAVDSSHMTASSSALWSRFSPPSNFANGHVSTMWSMVCRWPQS